MEDRVRGEQPAQVRSRHRQEGARVDAPRQDDALGKTHRAVVVRAGGDHVPVSVGDDQKDTIAHAGVSRRERASLSSGYADTVPLTRRRRRLIRRAEGPLGPDRVRVPRVVPPAESVARGVVPADQLEPEVAVPVVVQLGSDLVPLDAVECRALSAFSAVKTFRRCEQQVNPAVWVAQVLDPRCPALFHLHSVGPHRSLLSWLIVL